MPVDPHHLAGHYKKSKYEAEQVALKYASSGLPVVVDPAAPVGPWDRRGGYCWTFRVGESPARWTPA